MRFPFLKSGVCSVATSLLPVPPRSGVLVPVRVSSMGQIGLLTNYSYSIGSIEETIQKKKEEKK